jgi:hypothetical protein
VNNKLPQIVYISRNCLICNKEFKLRVANKKRALELEEQFKNSEIFGNKSFRRICDNPECKHKYRLLWELNYREKNRDKLNAKGKKWDKEHKEGRTLARRKHQQKLKRWVVDKESQVEKWLNKTYIRYKLMAKWRREDKIPDGIILLNSDCHRILTIKEILI